MLKIDKNNVLKVLHKKESEQVIRRFLNDGCDLFITGELPDNPVDLVRKAEANNPTAYIYSNQHLYFVDLRDNRYKKVGLSEEQVAHFYANFNIQ